jgi:hypothetical protein
MKKISATVFLALLLLGATQVRAQECSRISFAPGRTSAVLNGKVKRSSWDCYKLHARDGQRMTAHLTSLDKEARFSIGVDNDAAEDSLVEDVRNWEGKLSGGRGDFLITVVGTRPGTGYTLEISIPATSPTSTKRETACGDFSGTYTTEYGPLKLRRENNHVTGVYSMESPNDSRIDGTVSGNILTGRWKEASGTGTFRFVLAADGRSFKGSFRPDGHGSVSGEWSGRCEGDN